MSHFDTVRYTGISTRRWQSLLFLFTPACLGLLLAIIPHVHTLWNTGSLEYLADTDDVLYISIARQAAAGSWTVGDHHAPFGVHLPTTYAWFQFAPVARITGALGMSPPDFLFIWRVIGGAGLGISLFLLIRDALGRQWQGETRSALALLLAAICLADPGFRQGIPIVDIPKILSMMYNSEYIRPNPGEYAQYRVLSPLTGLPFVFLLLWRVLPGKRRDTAGAIIAGIVLGLLINLYFFFWTFAVALLALIAAWHLVQWLFNSKRSTREPNWIKARFCAIALLAGLTIGTPQILTSMNATQTPGAAEALDRTPRGIKLGPENPVRRMYLASRRLFVVLAIGVVAASLLRTPALRLLAVACGLAAALQASAFVTGIEFENYKWGHIAYTTGYLIICLAVADLIGRLHWLRSGFIRCSTATAVVLGLIAVVFVWREATETRDSAWQMRVNQEMRPLRAALWALEPSSRIAGPPELMVAALYTRAGILYGNHSFQSLISDAELSERFALSHWVMGSSEAKLTEDYPVGLPLDGQLLGERRERWKPDFVKEQIHKYYRAFTEADLDRYAISAVLLPAGEEPSPRSGQWKQASRTEQWSLWVRAGAARDRTASVPDD